MKELVPPLPSLVKNCICKGCIAVTCDAGHTSLEKANSSSVALARFLSLDLRSVPLELVSRKKYNKIHQQFQDGLLDAIEEDEEVKHVAKLLPFVLMVFVSSAINTTIDFPLGLL
jgi:hypothetical protein